PDSGVVAGSYGNTSNVANIVLNSKGVVTFATNSSIGGGTVSSVGLSLPTEFTVSGSPVTTSGTLTAVWKNENTNFIFAGTSSGASTVPTFRAMVNSDLPLSGVSAATYGDSSHVGQFTVLTSGVISSATNVSITGGSGGGVVGFETVLMMMGA